MRSHDSSARKLIEVSEVQNTSDLLSAIVEGITDAIYVKDLAGRYIMINSPGAKWMGRSVAEVIGKTDWEMFPPEMAEKFVESDQEIFATGKPLSYEERFKVGDSVLIAHTVKAAYKDSNGQVRGIIGVSRDISSSRESESELEKAYSLVKATLESTADGILVVDNHEHITGYNQRFLELWKIPKEKIEKQGYEWALQYVLEQLNHPDVCLERIHDLELHPTEESRDILTFKDGRVFERYSRPQKLGSDIVGRVFSYRDVTEERKERAERESYLSLLRTTLDATNDAILVVNLEGKTVTYNRNFLDVWGIPDEIVKSHDDAAMINWVKGQLTEPEQFVRHVSELYNNPSQESFDTIKFKSGKVLERFSRPHRLGEKIVGRVWSFRDITARVRAERSLKESEARKAAILASAIDPIITIDRNGRVVELNPAAEKAFGYMGADVIGRDLVDLIIAPRLQEAYRVGLAQYHKTGRSPLLGKRTEFQAMRADGTIFPAEISIVETRLDGQLLFTCFIRDISQRKANEALIRRGAAQIEALVEVSRELIAARLNLDKILDTVVARVSEYFQDGCAIRLFAEDGGRIDTVAFKHFNSEAEAFLRPLFEEAHAFIDKQATQAVLKEGKPITVSGRVDQMRARLAPEYWPVFDKYPVHSWMIVPLRVADQLIGVLTVFRYRNAPPYSTEENVWLQEVADRASLSIGNAKLYTDAMRAIQLREDFMSIASHELKTPLTPLKMQIQLLSHLVQTGVVSAGPLGEKLKSVISDSDQQIVRLSRLVDDILDATRLRTGQFALKLEMINLNALISSVLERLSRADIAGKSRIEFHPGEIKAGYWDRLRIEQVVINLVNNAIKFGLGKPIVVRTWMQDGLVKFSVQDFGIGIAKENQKRIFERLERAVSLKQFGGLGMGLFIARQIVELHRGSIILESTVGGGSTFTVELPLH